MEPTPEPKKQSAIEFAKEKLRINPDATYAEIKAQAKFESIPIFPVVYGRAKALLGLVPTAPYGSKSKARKQAAEEQDAQDRRSAQAAAAEAPVSAKPAASAANQTTSSRASSARGSANLGSSAEGLEAMIGDLRNAVQQRDRYREVLRKVAELIAAELAE